MSQTSPKSRIKKFIIAGVILLVIGAGAAWYIFTKSFTDTAKENAAYTVSAYNLIKEFQTDIAASNKKYTEQIVTVNGRVSAIENADTTLNIKMSDTITGSYAIFAFQAKDMVKVKQLKEGDSVSIKGSCSGGSYSDILQMHFINFKRCAVN
jgi:translation elongation factor P/translation initiation factor 5A